MATQLTQPIVRMIEYDGTTYKALMSVEGITITRKGGRRGVSLSWDEMLASRE